MEKDLIAMIINGRAYAIKVKQDIVERFRLMEKGEIPIPILLYLAYVDRAEVVDSEGRKLSFEELVSSIADVNVFSTFIVLYDLVKKGKKVSLNNNREIVILDENIEVYVLDEDSYVMAEDLYKLVDRAIKHSHRFIIAVVDINGEITYYEVSKTNFPRIEKR